MLAVYGVSQRHTPQPPYGSDYLYGTGFLVTMGCLLALVFAAMIFRMVAYRGTGNVFRTRAKLRWGLFALAAALEQASAHPLARAFEGIRAPAAEQVEEFAGRGLAGRVDGKEILAGSARFLRERGIACDERTDAALVVYVAEDGVLLGGAEIEDRLRPEAKGALLELKKTGVERIAVLTGDTPARARAALSALPVDEICSGLLPQEKPERARALKAYGKLMYVGDGVNDTPVMAESDVSVAMGGLGSDAAIEASDFVLATDNLNALPKAVKGARKTRRIVLENIVFSIAVKVAFMALSLMGVLPLWIAVFGDTGVMLLAVLNSMRMRAKI